MLIYIFFDFIILLFIIINDIKNKKIKLFSKYFILTIFYIVASMSYKIHSDMYFYENIYYEANLNNIFYSRFEPGYMLLNSIFNNFVNFIIFKIIIYFFMVVFIYDGVKKFINKEDITIFFALLFLLSAFYINLTVTLRQAIAVSIFIYSLQFLLTKKYLKYYIYIIFASFFHISAIVLLIIPLLFKIISKNLLFDFILLIITILLINTLFIDMIFINLTNLVSQFIPVLVHYSIKVTFEHPNFSLYSVFIFLLYLIVLMLFISKKEKTKIDIFIYKGFVMFIILYFLNLKITFFYRFLFYFYIFQVFIFIFLFNRFRKNISYYIVKYVSVFIFIFLLNLRVIYNQYANDARLIPYHSSIELLFYNIPYRNTAQYYHNIESFGTAYPR